MRKTKPGDRQLLRDKTSQETVTFTDEKENTAYNYSDPGFQHEVKVLCCLPTSILHLNDFFFSFRFYSQIYLRSKIQLLILRFGNNNKIDTMIRQLESKSFLFFLRDHLRSTLGITCGPFWGSFAVSGSFAVGDHLRYCTVQTMDLCKLLKYILRLVVLLI